MNEQETREEALTRYNELEDIIKSLEEKQQKLLEINQAQEEFDSDFVNKTFDDANRTLF